MPTSILDRRLSDIPELRKLWEDATAGYPAPTDYESARRAYDNARDRFVTRLTDDTDDARKARRVFENGGFKFLTDPETGKLKKALPILDLPDLEGRLDRKHYDLLRVSGQHLEKVVDRPDKALEVRNIMLTTGRDNVHMDASNPHSVRIRKETVSEIVDGRDTTSPTHAAAPPLDRVDLDGSRTPATPAPPALHEPHMPDAIQAPGTPHATDTPHAPNTSHAPNVAHTPHAPKLLDRIGDKLHGLGRAFDAVNRVEEVAKVVEGVGRIAAGDRDAGTALLIEVAGEATEDVLMTAAERLLPPQAVAVYTASTVGWEVGTLLNEVIVQDLIDRATPEWLTEAYFERVQKPLDRLMTPETDDRADRLGTATPDMSQRAIVADDAVDLIDTMEMGEAPDAAPSDSRSEMDPMYVVNNPTFADDAPGQERVVRNDADAVPAHATIADRPASPETLDTSNTDVPVTTDRSVDAASFESSAANTVPIESQREDLAGILDTDSGPSSEPSAPIAQSSDADEVFCAVDCIDEAQTSTIDSVSPSIATETPAPTPDPASHMVTPAPGVDSERSSNHMCSIPPTEDNSDAAPTSAHELAPLTSPAASTPIDVVDADTRNVTATNAADEPHASTVDTQHAVAAAEHHDVAMNDAIPAQALDATMADTATTEPDRGLVPAPLDASPAPDAATIEPRANMPSTLTIAAATPADGAAPQVIQSSESMTALCAANSQSQDRPQPAAASVAPSEAVAATSDETPASPPTDTARADAVTQPETTGDSPATPVDEPRATDSTPNASETAALDSSRGANARALDGSPASVDGSTPSAVDGADHIDVAVADGANPSTAATTPTPSASAETSTTEPVEPAADATSVTDGKIVDRTVQEPAAIAPAVVAEVDAQAAAGADADMSPAAIDASAQTTPGPPEGGHVDDAVVCDARASTGASTSPEHRGDPEIVIVVEDNDDNTASSSPDPAIEPTARASDNEDTSSPTGADPMANVIALAETRDDSPAITVDESSMAERLPMSERSGDATIADDWSPPTSESARQTDAATCDVSTEADAQVVDASTPAPLDAPTPPPTDVSERSDVAAAENAAPSASASTDATPSGSADTVTVQSIDRPTDVTLAVDTKSVDLTAREPRPSSAVAAEELSTQEDNHPALSQAHDDASATTDEDNGVCDATAMGRSVADERIADDWIDSAYVAGANGEEHSALVDSYRADPGASDVMASTPDDHGPAPLDADQHPAASAAPDCLAAGDTTIDDRCTAVNGAEASSRQAWSSVDGEIDDDADSEPSPEPESVEPRSEHAESRIDFAPSADDTISDNWASASSAVQEGERHDVMRASELRAIDHLDTRSYEAPRSEPRDVSPASYDRPHDVAPSCTTPEVTTNTAPPPEPPAPRPID